MSSFQIRSENMLLKQEHISSSSTFPAIALGFCFFVLICFVCCCCFFFGGGGGGEIFAYVTFV